MSLKYAFILSRIDFNYIIGRYPHILGERNLSELEFVRIHFWPLFEEIGIYQNWNLSESEFVRIGICQNGNLSEWEFVRIGNCQNQNLSEWEFVRIGNCQNRNLSELEFVSIGISQN